MVELVSVEVDLIEFIVANCPYNWQFETHGITSFEIRALSLSRNVSDSNSRLLDVRDDHCATAMDMWLLIYSVDEIS